MVLFRSATKQICRRNGFHASFMSRPRMPGFLSSGWHLHLSVADVATGRNVFASGTPEAHLSPFGSHFVGGLVEHAREAAIFAAPTINAYKRYRPNSLAPDRANWGCDNRGAMIRVCGTPGDPTTHLENRAGDPAANPYLYIASQIIAGLDGVDAERDPGPATDTPYATHAAPLPQTLGEAIGALDDSALFRSSMGDGFVDFILAHKRSELSRYEAFVEAAGPAGDAGSVTDWEHREYFDVF
jgi:glutamine synthetase